MGQHSFPQKFYYFFQNSILIILTYSPLIILTYSPTPPRFTPFFYLSLCFLKTMKYFLKKTDFSHFYINQLPITIQFAVRLHPHFLLYDKILSALSLSRSWACCDNRCEFICATTLWCPENTSSLNSFIFDWCNWTGICNLQEIWRINSFGWNKDFWASTSFGDRCIV